MGDDVRLEVRFPVDDAALSQLHSRAFTEKNATSNQPWADRLMRYSLTWVGAFDSGALVGFVHACWDGGAHAFLLDTVVNPEYQHRRIGRLLVERLVAEVTDAGCGWLHVDYEPHLAPSTAAPAGSPQQALASCGFAEDISRRTV